MALQLTGYRRSLCLAPESDRVRPASFIPQDPRSRAWASGDAWHLVMYGLLFLGLPALGLWLFVRLCQRMAAGGVPEAPVAPLFAVFAAYGAIFLFGVSAAFGVWSGMHSLAALGLCVVALPWLLFQGVRLMRDRTRSPYHHAAAVLSLAFPLALGALYVLATVVER